MSTPNKNLALPAYNSTGWDVPLNSNFSELDTAVAGFQYINLASYAGGTIVLTNTFPIVSTPLTSLSYIPANLVVYGALAGNAIIQIPSGITGQWVFRNATGGAYTVTVSSGGGGAYFVVPQGAIVQLISDGTGIFAVGIQTSAQALFAVGDYKSSASPAAQAGWLLCYGQAVSRTTYSALFAAIGAIYGAGDGSTTFNIPDKRGRAGAGADNMGGTAAGRLTGFTIGVAGGVQSFVMSVAQLASHTHPDAGHGHTDAGHGHTTGPGSLFSSSSSGFSVQNGGGANFVGYINTGYANIQTGYANIQYTGSNAAISLVQPTIAEYVFIYAGV